MHRKQAVTFVVAFLATIVVASAVDPFAEIREPNQPPPTGSSFQPNRLRSEPRGFIKSLPPAGNTIDSYLKYCEAVIHSLESELPRKSIFRSLFMDKARLASGYDKHVKFSYFDVLKNLPDQHY